MYFGRYQKSFSVRLKAQLPFLVFPSPVMKELYSISLNGIVRES
jgi:hypothetical protein